MNLLRKIFGMSLSIHTPVVNIYITGNIDLTPVLDKLDQLLKNGATDEGINHAAHDLDTKTNELDQAVKANS